jgi:hypothetical protein
MNRLYGLQFFFFFEVTEIDGYNFLAAIVPTHPDLKNIINCAVLHLKPEKSKRQYEKRYSDFRRLETGVTRRM